MQIPRKKSDKDNFDILSSIEKHIQALKPLSPKQVIVGVGEYPIKTLLKDPILNRESTLPIFIEKSSDDIYKWIPKGYKPHFILGFEDIDTHFWYNVLPSLIKDKSIIESLRKKTLEKLRGAIIFSSVWDGVGSATLPTLISKFKSESIDSLSVALLPSKIQPADSYFNAYSTLKMCETIDGATVLLLGRDQLEKYDGVNRKGTQIKGNKVVNYLLDLFLEKESLVQEVAELSRTFNVKFFTVIAVTAASYQVYSSLENMLNIALLKPLLSFDLSSASLLYVLLRIPNNLREKIPRAKIELEITDWFKEKTNLQSIHITEPIYIEEMNDRIDAILFIGGFDMTQLLDVLDKKIEKIKNKALKQGYITENWQLPVEVEEKQTTIKTSDKPQKPDKQTTPEKLMIAETEKNKKIKATTKKTKNLIKNRKQAILPKTKKEQLEPQTGTETKAKTTTKNTRTKKKKITKNREE